MSRSYFNSASNYSNSSTSSYYNDMYRSFTNLRNSQQNALYQQPLYISTTVPYSFIKKPSLGDRDSKYGDSISKRSTSTSRLYNPRSTISSSTTKPETRQDDSARYSSNGNNTFEEANSDSNRGTSIPIKKREGSYESVYSGSRSSTPPHLTNSGSSMVSSSSISPSSNSSTTSNEDSPSTRLLYSSSKQELEKYSDSNDLTATATSNIQLNCTDDLTTQVDYYLNEVDYRMICRGKNIELESFELSSRGGLISKCLYLNELLNEACMNESYFETDPIFFPNGKATLLFGSAKDSEEFATRHSQKFNVLFMNRQTQNSGSDSRANNSTSNTTQNNSSSSKKNVSFIEKNHSDSYNEYLESDSRNKSILKNQSLRNSNSSLSPSKSHNSSNNQLGNNIINNNTNETVPNEKSDASILVSANSAKKDKKTEGYEILTIKAKLKQRVGQNRTKAVELHDIDSIMRNVVTIIQDEFMKRFPSGPAVPVSSAIKSN